MRKECTDPLDAVYDVVAVHDREFRIVRSIRPRIKRSLACASVPCRVPEAK